MDKPIKIQCSICLHDTNHERLFHKLTLTKEEQYSKDPELWVSQGFYYSLFECQGCSNIVMRKDFWHSELTPVDWDISYRSWHPALVTRQTPKWLSAKNDVNANLLKQVYAAMNADLLSLAMMGIRTVLDQYLVEKVKDIGGFQAKLKKAAELGFLSAKQVELVEPALDAGNAASHRGFNPSAETLLYCLEVVENLLHQDELAKATNEVATQIPKR
jgi:hypothetical protein